MHNKKIFITIVCMLILCTPTTSFSCFATIGSWLGFGKTGVHVAGQTISTTTVTLLSINCGNNSSAQPAREMQSSFSANGHDNSRTEPSAHADFSAHPLQIPQLNPPQSLYPCWLPITCTAALLGVLAVNKHTQQYPRAAPTGIATIFAGFGLWTHGKFTHIDSLRTTERDHVNATLSQHYCSTFQKNAHIQAELRSSKEKNAQLEQELRISHTTNTENAQKIGTLTRGYEELTRKTNEQTTTISTLAQQLAAAQQSPTQPTRIFSQPNSFHVLASFSNPRGLPLRGNQLTLTH